MSVWSTLTNDDEWKTPKILWDNIKDYLPSKDIVVWEAFYGDGKSGNHLSDLGCTVIQSDVDFFDEIGLSSHLGPSRSNGLNSLKRQIKNLATELQKN